MPLNASSELQLFNEVSGPGILVVDCIWTGTDQRLTDLDRPQLKFKKEQATRESIQTSRCGYET
jgi:hypothetical protein